MEIISEKARSIYRCFGASLDDIKSDCKNDKHVIARTALIGYLIDEEGYGYSAVGKLINRTHGSVINLYDSFGNYMKEPLFRDLYSGEIAADWKDIVLVIKKEGPYLGRDIKAIYFHELSFAKACSEYRKMLNGGRLDPNRKIISNLV